MSSVHKQPGRRYWFCAYYDPDGFRRFRSTGLENQRAASVVCTAIERGSKLARTGKLSPEKAHKIVRETVDTIAEAHGKTVAERGRPAVEETLGEFVRAAGGELTSYTIRTWIASWLRGRTDASKATVERYSGILELFLKQLGKRADRALSTLSHQDVEAFRDAQAESKSPAGANLALKVIKSCLGAAVAKRQLEFSPAEHVETVLESGSQRRPFTREEIQTLLRTASDEWKTLILVGFFSGQRLGDCAALTWRSVDLASATMSLTTAKTAKRMVIPIAPPLHRHLMAMAGDNPDAPLCPALHGKRTSILSNQFHALMVRAGLVEPRPHRSKGKGRAARRDVSAISFHSLRYSAVSELKNAGVSESVAMDLVGHESTAVSRHYTRIADATKRDAVGKLPDITL